MGAAEPYWRQHAAAVQHGLATVPTERPLVLVGHSGAGPLLPIVRQSATQRVLRYLFVDADLPHPGKSRLDEIRMSAPEFAAELERELLAELHPRPLAFFTEALPDVPGWPDAPCGYVLFSQAYEAAAEQALSAGWPVRSFDMGHLHDVGHFHMVVDSGAVAAALAEMALDFHN